MLILSFGCVWLSWCCVREMILPAFRLLVVKRCHWCACRPVGLILAVRSSSLGLTGVYHENRLSTWRVQYFTRPLAFTVVAATIVIYPPALKCPAPAGSFDLRNLTPRTRGMRTLCRPSNSIASRRIKQLFGLTAGFLTFARLIVPLRIALALALTPAADKYIVKGLLNKTGEAAVDVDAAEVRVPRRGRAACLSVYLSSCVSTVRSLEIPADPQSSHAIFVLFSTTQRNYSFSTTFGDWWHTRRKCALSFAKMNSCPSCTRHSSRALIKSKRSPMKNAGRLAMCDPDVPVPRLFSRRSSCRLTPLLILSFRAVVPGALSCLRSCLLPLYPGLLRRVLSCRVVSHVLL